MFFSKKAPLTKQDQAFWTTLQLGYLVMLSDLQSVAEISRRGDQAGFLMYQITEIRKIVEQNNIGIWYLYKMEELTPGQQAIYLMVKVVDTQFDLRLYLDMDGFQSDIRSELVDQGSWVFDNPQRNIAGTAYNDLYFTPQIVNTVDTGKGFSSEINYFTKSQGALNGTCEVFPRRTGVDDLLLATLQEYSTSDTTVDNTEVLILEVGSEASDLGGLVEAFWGARLDMNDIDVTPPQQ